MKNITYSQMVERVEAAVKAKSAMGMTYEESIAEVLDSIKLELIERHQVAIL